MRRTNSRCVPTSSVTARSRKSCLRAPWSDCACAWRVTARCRLRRHAMRQRGSLLEVSRTLPEQRDFPVTPGQRSRSARAASTCCRRRSRALQPWRPRAEARALRVAVAGDARRTHADPRHAARRRAANSRRPACRRGDRPEVRTADVATASRGRAAAVRAPGRAAACARPDPHARRRIARATLAVAASLLRHVPAEADLSWHPCQRRPRRNAPCLRDLLDARSVALADTASTCVRNCAPARWRPSCRANWPCIPTACWYSGSPTPSTAVGLARRAAGRRRATRGTDRDAARPDVGRGA